MSAYSNKKAWLLIVYVLFFGIAEVDRQIIRIQDQQNNEA